jgi:hypothetical protein
MASPVDICNLALAHLGDSATVASIDPPEGSAQAEHCARFYPIARDHLLEEYLWGFTMRRGALALLESPTTAWAYCYARPNLALRLVSVQAADAADDTVVEGQSAVIPQEFIEEALDDGTRVIYTDLENAHARYSVLVTDTTKWSPKFVTCLGWLLASYLAGPVIRGRAGQREAERCLALFRDALGSAAAIDANQRRKERRHSVPWMAAR